MAFVRHCCRNARIHFKIYVQSVRQCSVPRITRPQRDFPDRADREVRQLEQPKAYRQRPTETTEHEDKHIEKLDYNTRERLNKDKFLHREIQSYHIPRITVPPKLADRLYDKKIKLIDKKASVDPEFLGPVKIKCNRPDLNHHKFERVGKFNSKRLASAHWKNAKYVGDSFVFNALDRNPALYEKNNKERNFKETGLRPEICDVLKEYGLEIPTRIQSLTIPALLSGKNVMCSAETGGGKTLAFLLPMVQRVLDHIDEFGKKSARNQPLGVILVPTHELADQIYDVAKDLAVPLGFRVSSLVGRYSTRQFNKNKEKYMDILIATPGFMSKAIALRHVNVDRVVTYVFDEADILFDDSFQYTMQKLLSRATIRASAQMTIIPETDQGQIEATSNGDEDDDVLPEEALEYDPTTAPVIPKRDKDNKLTFTSDTWQDTGNDKSGAKSSDSPFENAEELQSDSKDESNAYLLKSLLTHQPIVSPSKSGSNHVGKKDSESDGSHSETSVFSDNESLNASDDTHAIAAKISDTNSHDSIDTHSHDDINAPEIAEYHNEVGDNTSPFDIYKARDDDDLDFNLQAETEVTEMSTVQWCMVGATIPINAEDTLVELAPRDSIEVVKTEGIHKVLPHVTQKFLRVNSKCKDETLLNALRKCERKSIPTIVFCNKSTTVMYLQRMLKEHDITNFSALYKLPHTKGERQGIFMQWHNESTDILVTTDIASRGLDTTRAQLVINFDFPHHMADYVHRAGRVGRVGCKGTGQVLNFVQTKWDVELLWAIEGSVRRNTQLHGVHRNVKRYHEQRHARKQSRQAVAISV